jgi:hypothetical protein
MENKRSRSLQVKLKFSKPPYAAYSILNGLGLMVLVVTGISVSGVFGKKKWEGQQ